MASNLSEKSPFPLPAGHHRAPRGSRPHLSPSLPNPKIVRSENITSNSNRKTARQLRITLFGVSEPAPATPHGTRTIPRHEPQAFLKSSGLRRLQRRAERPGAGNAFVRRGAFPPGLRLRWAKPPGRNSAPYQPLPGITDNVILDSVIRSFRDQGTAHVFSGDRTKAAAKACPPNLERVARRKLDQLNQAEALDDLRAPPGNRLEALSGDRKGQHSIRINDQYRICFHWTQAGPEQVEIVDYHR